MRRVFGVVGIVAGAFLLVAPLAFDLFETSAAASRVLRDVDPLFSETGITELRTALDDGQAAVDELGGGAALQILASTGLTPSEFAARYPATTAALTQLPEAYADADATVSNLEAHAHDYELASELPGLGLPVRSGPWITMGIGAAMVVLGIVVLRSPAHGPQIALGVLGLVLVVAPLAMRYPARLDATSDTLASITPTPEGVARSGDQIEAADAALTELREQVIPDAAAHNGVTIDEFEATFADSFPGLDDALVRSDEILAPFRRGFEFREARLDDLLTLKDAHIEAALWIHVVPGLAVTLAGLATLVAGFRARRRDAARSPVAS